MTSCLPSPGFRLPGSIHCPVQTSLSYFHCMPTAGMTKTSQCKHSRAVSKKKCEILGSSSFALLFILQSYNPLSVQAHTVLLW